MVELENIYFAYRRSAPVLEKIDLTLEAGRIYGLLGKNGEGKTTLLKIIGGLVFPDSGSCLVFGEKPANRKVDFLRQIFLLPEEITYPDVTAGEYFRMYAPFYPTFSQKILDACIESLEIDRSTRLARLSQGQKKKVAIALALAVHTPLLLMDEPTNGLDIPSKSIFRQLVASFTDTRQTIVISTHQVRDLESLIDTAVILHRKRILLNSTLDEIGNRLFFKLLAPGEKTLYAENEPAGLMGVGENEKGEETPVSLELLFNAAVTNPEEMKRIFNR